MAGGNRVGARARASLDEKQVGMLGLVLAALVAGGAYMTGPALKARLSAMPIAGQVVAPQMGEVALGNPTELPVALAIPQEGAAGMSDNSLEMIEEAFVPSSNLEMVDPEMEARGKAEQAIRQALSQLSVDAVSNTGMFLSGQFFRFGERLGMRFPDGAGGSFEAVLAGSDGKRAKIRVGEISHWIGGPHQ